jgi:hypothetical protein
MGKTEGWQGEGRIGTKGEGWQMGVHEGMCNGKVVAVTVVSWGHWWWAHWEWWQRRWRHGIGGKARYVFRHLDMDGNGGGKGGKAEEEKCKKEGEEKGKDGG